jgi:hypothetical protein
MRQSRYVMRENRYVMRESRPWNLANETQRQAEAYRTFGRPPRSLLPFCFNPLCWRRYHNILSLFALSRAQTATFLANQYIGGAS